MKLRLPCLHRRAAALAGALLFALAPCAALAGAARPCSEPIVFQGAAVNSFVLPYRYVGGRRTPELELASRQIAALAHLDLLFSMLKYGSVGGTDLLAEGGRTCDVDDVIAQVTRRGGPGVLLPGRTLVVVWGRLYEEGEQLYLQSYARFLRQGDKGPVPETITVQLTGEGVELPLRATLPTQSIAFPPRRIGKADLAAVAARFREAMVVRPEPTLKAAGKSIDFEPGRSFPYYVTKTTRTKEDGDETVDWMWIEPMAGGPGGWVRARTGETAESWSLQRWLPELAYVDALHGFMRLRARGAEPLDSSRVQRIRGWIDTGFARFESAVRLDEGSAAYGLARAVRGFVAWDLQQDAPGRAAAARLFAEARALMPEYAAARNLAAATNPLGAEARLGLDKTALDKLHRELLNALALDSRDALVLGNLDQFYRTLSAKPALSTLEGKDIDRRLEIVKAARAAAVEMK